MNDTNTTKHPIVLGVTGASGSVYATRLTEELQKAGYTVELICSEAGEQVAKYEKESKLFELVDKRHGIENYFAPPASGTAKYTAMVVLPCSMGTLGAISAGAGLNLLIRSADVFLKEHKPLIVCPREMPLSRIHLQNMLTIQEAGAKIIPPNPFFYYHPKTIDDLVDTVVGKILDQLGISHGLFKPWAQAGEVDS